MNYNNLAQQSNFLAGSPEFPDLPFYLTTVNVPGITLSPAQLGSRAGSKIYRGQDNIDFDSLSIEMLVDENLEIWRAFMTHIRNKVKLDKTFNTDGFEFWIQLNNTKGNKLFTLLFNDCRITSVGAMTLDTSSDLTHYTLPVEIVYDYYDIIDGQVKFNGAQSKPEIPNRNPCSPE